jgi:hypothetical protein
MDQKELGDSIARQLDSIVDIANWTLFLALVFFWAGFSKQDHPIKVLGLEVGSALSRSSSIASRGSRLNCNKTSRSPRLARSELL